MSNYEETLENFKKEMEAMNLSYHEELYHAIAKHLGPAIYDRDASLVACSDQSERDTIKRNFLMGKLEMEDTPRLDAAIEEICHALGESNRNKHRVTFYYLLVAILEKESVFIDHE